MAQFGRKTEGFVASRAVKIVHTEIVENYTVYVIEITLGQYKWRVRHRYSEFYELHEKLVSQYKLDKGLLPPKKLFGNQSESFVKKRQGELETYLQTVLLHLSELPVVLVYFLEFNKYEIHGLAQVLAEELYHKGDLILQAGEVFHITPIELHAITARLKLPEPTCESGDSKKDLGHVLDFITRVTALKVQGTAKMVGTSNINMNELPFELTNLKSIQSLELHSCNPQKISGVDHLKKILKKIHVHHSVKAMKDILLVDVGFGQWTGAENESVLVPAWSALTSADFSHNAIISIDQSVKLMPKVEYIDLSHNQLDGIQELQNLSSLTHLDLSYNRFHLLDSLHTKLGNVKSMNLAGNKLESLSGLSKLYSLETLNVSTNDISQVLEIRHVSCLPCLERLILSGNPVTIVLDYRTKILELFGDRAREVCLDNTRATQKELDTVAILLAIQKSKDSKDKNKKHSSKKPAKEVEIAEAPSTLSSIASQTEPSQGTTFTPPVYPSTSSTSGNQKGHPPDSQASPLSSLLEPATKNKLGHQFDFHSHSASSSPVTTFHPPLAQFMLPETLPSRNDSTLISVLQSLLPDTHALTKQGGVGSEDPHREERPVHLIWCTAIGYTQPFREFPAGIFITTENVHIFEVRSLRGASGMPVLEHASCVPLMNIQQIVLGYESQYIRIEEAFVGPQGTFAFLMANTKKADLFLDSLKLAYRRAVPDLDQYEDPHIVINGETEVNLKKALSQFEGIAGDSSSIELVLYMLVHTIDFSQRGKIFTTHSLVITSNYLYLLKEDYIFWPQPTFAIGPSTRPQFEVAAVFPIMGRITGIQMYDSDTYSPDQDTSLSQNFSSVNSSAMVVPNFIGYGVKLTFALGGELGNQDLDIRVPTSGMRDKFLATLTQVRKDISEKYPSPPKSKSKAKSRNVEPDSASGSSTNSGGKKAKNKMKTKEYQQTSNNNNSKMNSDSSEEFVIAPESQGEMVRPDSLPYVDPMYILDQDVRDLELGHQTSGSSDTPGDLSQRESPTGQSTSTLESMSAELATRETHLELPKVPQIRRTPPPSSLGVIYPSMQLLGHLTVCNEDMPLLVPLSPGMRNLACSSGEEILNFFHNNIAEISTENEELRHIMWTAAVPYICPNQELPTCILLSTRALYFVSDIAPKVPRKMTTLIKQPWKSHSRNKSDSYSFSASLIGQATSKESEHHTSGILHGVHGSKKGQGVVRSYHIMPLRSIRQVQVGMLDQSVRLTGSTPEQTYCCVTRDNELTAAFIKHLMSSLSHVHPTPSPDLNSSDSEQDFYKMFTEYNRTDHTEYTHPSKVKFCYPSEDSMADYNYQIKESIRGQKPKGGEVDLLVYLLVLQVDDVDEVLELDVGKGRPRTLLMTSHHIALAIEDHVSYPIPDFSISLPDAPQLAIQAIICLELVKRIVVSDFTSHDLTLVFADEPEEINVDTSVNYYSENSGAVAKRSKSVPEKSWTLIIQNLGDKDKLIKAITRQWTEFHPEGELSVQVSS